MNQAAAQIARYDAVNKAAGRDHHMRWQGNNECCITAESCQRPHVPWRRPPYASDIRTAQKLIGWKARQGHTALCVRTVARAAARELALVGLHSLGGRLGGGLLHQAERHAAGLTRATLPRLQVQIAIQPLIAWPSRAYTNDWTQDSCLPKWT